MVTLLVNPEYGKATVKINGEWKEYEAYKQYSFSPSLANRLLGLTGVLGPFFLELKEA
jgi:hypothetical protein